MADATDDAPETTPFATIYYQTRQEALAAVRAADRLGLGIHLFSRWIFTDERQDIRTLEWVLDLAVTSPEED